jgi:WD40 repeat protein
MGAQPDGDLNVFWTNNSDEVAIWDLAANTWTNNPSGLYGPHPTWTAYAFATGPTGMERVFWQEAAPGSTPGEMSLYRVTSPGPVSPTAFNPLAAGWLPDFIGVGPNNYERVFFSNSATGQTQLWNLSPTNVNTVVTYIAHPGWWPISMSVAPNNDPQLMWVNDNGQLSTWDINPAGTPAATLYGPY